MSNFENHAQRDLVREAVFTESNEEFILPDYMPEIGRVLRVSATLLPDEPYPEAGSIEFSGRIEYRLLYGDGEGNITEAPLEGRYRYRLTEEECGDAVIYTEERIESVGARPSAQRKLGLRTRICARPHLLREEEIGTPPEKLTPNEAMAERIERDVALLSRGVYDSGLLHREECFSIEDASPDALSLLSVQSAFLPEGKTAHEGHVSVSGRLIYTLLLKKEGCVPFVKVCTLPIDEEISAKDARPCDAVLLRAHLGAPSITFEADGEHTSAHIDAEYALSGVLLRNRSATVLEDLYLHGAHHDVVRKPFCSERLIGSAFGCFTVGEELSLPADFKTEGCLFPAFTCKEATVTRIGDKAVASGSLTVSLLSFDVGEASRCELSLPFRTELSLATGAENEVLSVNVTPVYGSAQAGGAGVRLSVELTVCVTATEPITLSLPASLVKRGDIPPHDARTIKLYYPTDKDTLWSVGKKYGVPLSVLREENAIPEDEDPTMPLDGYTYLFVSRL